MVPAGIIIIIAKISVDNLNPHFLQNIKRSLVIFFIHIFIYIHDIKDHRIGEKKKGTGEVGGNK